MQYIEEVTGNIILFTLTLALLWFKHMEYALQSETKFDVKDINLYRSGKKRERKCGYNSEKMADGGAKMAIVSLKQMRH